MIKVSFRYCKIRVVYKILFNHLPSSYATVIIRMIDTVKKKGKRKTTDFDEIGQIASLKTGLMYRICFMVIVHTDEVVYRS